jgi:UDP-glucose 4-epimerase
LHPYATSHKAAEDCVLAVNQSRDIQGIVLRLSNVVGAPLDKEIKCWTLLVNDICRQAVTTKKIILRSNGAQYRDFISISTVNNAISCLIKNNSSALGGIYNLGSGKSVSVLDISKTVQELFLKEYGLNIEITINQDDNYKLIDRLQYRVDKIKQIVPKFDSSIKNDLSDVLDFTVSFYNN